jgi:hypothetical protein
MIPEVDSTQSVYLTAAIYPTPTGFPQNRSEWIYYITNSFSPNIVPESSIDFIQLILLFTVLPLLAFALEFEAKRNDRQLYDDETLRLQLREAWRTDHWPPLLALTEQWVHGSIPWGPWNADSIAKRWPHKGYIKRLCRAGIIPLYIRNGGIMQFQISNLKIDGWKFILPEYERSNGRAHFDFILPCPWGMSQTSQELPELDIARMRFRQLLKHQTDYAVTISYWKDGVQSFVPAEDSHFEYSMHLKPMREHFEIGARSRFKYLLPFKSEDVLKPMKELKGPMRLLRLTEYVHGNWKNTETTRAVERAVPLLRHHDFAIIRIEALDYKKHKLDEWVYRKLNEAEMKDIWTLGDLSESLAKVYHDCGIATNPET